MALFFMSNDLDDSTLPSLVTKHTSLPLAGYSLLGVTTSHWRCQISYSSCISRTLSSPKNLRFSFRDLRNGLSGTPLLQSLALVVLMNHGELFTNPLLLNPHDCKAPTMWTVLPSLSTNLEWNLAPLSHICRSFELLLFFYEQNISLALSFPKLEA